MKKYISHNFSVWRETDENPESLSGTYISGTYENAIKEVVELLEKCQCKVRLLWTRQEMLYTGHNHYTGSPYIDNILSICSVDGPWYDPQEVINKIKNIKNPTMISKPEHKEPIKAVVENSLKD